MAETILHAVERVRALPHGAPEAQRQATLFGVVVECSMPRPTRGSGAAASGDMWR